MEREEFWRAHYRAMGDVDERTAAGRVCYSDAEITTLAQHALEILDVAPCDTILDVGAAKGILSRRLAKHVRRCVTLDWIRAFLPTVVADARALPFQGGAFDLAILSGVLMLLSPVGMGKSLRELARVTRRAALVAANPFVHVHDMAAVFERNELLALARDAGWARATAHDSASGTDQAQYYFDVVLRH